MSPLAPDVLRSDVAVQDAARALFLGSAPERATELDQLWKKYCPKFYITGDTHENDRLIMDAGRFREVRFNHRILRAFWLAAYAAWEGYSAVHAGILAGQPAKLGRFQELLDAFEAVITSDAADVAPLPEGVAEPGVPETALDQTSRAPAELAIMASGWALLHEIRHIRHQQDGTGAGAYETDPVKLHAEELSCDAYATCYLLEQAVDYAHDQKVPLEKVRLKRELAIYFALFAITLLTRDYWGSSPTHPAVADRIKAVRAEIGGAVTEEANGIATMAFAALQEVWPGAPVFA